MEGRKNFNTELEKATDATKEDEFPEIWPSMNLGLGNQTSSVGRNKPFRKW